MKGCPYDNAVAESTFKSFKAEFVYRRIFTSIEQLQLEYRKLPHGSETIGVLGLGMGGIQKAQTRRSRRSSARR